MKSSSSISLLGVVIITHANKTANPPIALGSRDVVPPVIVARNILVLLLLLGFRLLGLDKLGLCEVSERQQVCFKSYPQTRLLDVLAAGFSALESEQ